MKVQINVEYLTNQGREAGKLMFKASDSVLYSIVGNEPTKIEKELAIENALWRMNEEGCFNLIGNSEDIEVNGKWFYNAPFHQLEPIPNVSYPLLFCLDTIGINYFSIDDQYYVGDYDAMCGEAERFEMSREDYCKRFCIEVTENYVCKAIVIYQENNNYFRS